MQYTQNNKTKIKFKISLRSGEYCTVLTQYSLYTVLAHDSILYCTVLTRYSLYCTVLTQYSLYTVLAHDSILYCTVLTRYSLYCTVLTLHCTRPRLYIVLYTYSPSTHCTLYSPTTYSPTTHCTVRTDPTLLYCTRTHPTH